MMVKMSDFLPTTNDQASVHQMMRKKLVFLKIHSSFQDWTICFIADPIYFLLLLWIGIFAMFVKKGTDKQTFQNCQVLQPLALNWTKQHGCKYKYNFGAGQKKRYTLICIISGRGRKTVGAIAPTAPISSAPLFMFLSLLLFSILSRCIV